MPHAINLYIHKFYVIISNIQICFGLLLFKKIENDVNYDNIF
jgi:hypothetical protein